MSRIRAAPLGLALLLLAATLSGCAAPALTTDDGADDDASADAGHPLGPSRLHVRIVLLDGVRRAVAAEGETTWRLGADAEPPAQRRALVLHEARVDGAVGTLLALPDGETLRLDGALRYEASALAFADGLVRHRLAPPQGVAFPEHDAARDERLREAGLFEDAFFASRVGLAAEGPVVVSASRVVFVDARGATELGPRATVAEFGSAAATAQLERLLPPAPQSFEIAERRGHLALGDASGALDLPRDDRVERLAGAALLTLGRGARVTLTPAGEGARVEVEGRAFQVVTDEGALLRSRLELRILQREVPLAQGQGAEVAFELRALDPDADPVITAIRIEGAPEGLVRLPGHVPMTEQVLSAFKGDPIMTVGVLPAIPALVVMDAFLAIVDFFAGPAKVTQAIEAGTTFRSRLGVTGDQAPYEATVIVEGNFPTTRATVRVG